MDLKGHCRGGAVLGTSMGVLGCTMLISTVGLCTCCSPACLALFQAPSVPFLHFLIVCQGTWDIQPFTVGSAPPGSVSPTPTPIQDAWRQTQAQHPAQLPGALVHPGLRKAVACRVSESRSLLRHVLPHSPPPPPSHARACPHSTTSAPCSWLPMLRGPSGHFLNTGGMDRHRLENKGRHGQIVENSPGPR